jgi:two-component system, LytTR family, response regulator
MTIRSAIIDDEPLVRSTILRVLRADPEIEIVGEYGDGISALEAINLESPDLIFLDVHMPGLTGMQVLDAIEGEKIPVTVFVTAHRDYAIEAFEADAVDYILKPFGRERLEKAVARAKARVASSVDGLYAQRLLQTLSSIQKKEQYQDRIAVPVNGRILLLETNGIDWVEADRNVVRLHSGDRIFELRSTLSDLATRLDPKQFARIHRSTLVNIRQVKEIHPWFHGHHRVILKTGVELRMSRNMGENAKSILGFVNR